MKKILVIDDMKSFREQIVSILSSEGFEVIGADDGLKGLEIAKEYLPDLIICDIMMPEIDGYQVLDTLREHTETATIPFIFTTVKSEREDVRQGMSLGADDYITKPFTAQEIITAVKTGLSKRDKLNQHYNTIAEKVTKERLQYLLSTCPAVIYSCCPSDYNKFTYISNNITTLLGYTPEEFVEEKGFWNNHIHVSDLPRVLSELSHMKEQNFYTIEYRFLCKDGNYRWIYDERRLISDNLGNPLDIVGSWLDITEKKTAEEDLLRLSTAIEQSVESVVITDTSGNIQYVNPAFEMLSGYCKDEITGKNCRMFKSDKHDREFYDRMWHIISEGNVWKGLISNKKKDDTLYDIKTTISPVKDITGKIINYVSVMYDITGELKMENQLRQAQKMEAIGTLASGIAHDFNNVLAVIIGYTEMALYKPKSITSKKYYLEQILNSAHKAKDLIVQILSFSRSREEEVKPVKVSSIIRESLKLLKPTLQENIKIRKNLEAKSDIIMAESTQINQVIMNLCTNSIYAMSESGGVLEVGLTDVMLDSYDVACYTDLPSGPYVKLTVSDTGHGMTQEIVERIFEPFYTTKEKGEGTGLGLSIVHGIVKNLRGVITVYSEPWVGTTFEILIPRIECKTGKRVDEIVEMPEGSGTVLFVEDEESVHYMMKEMIERLGYKIVSTLNSTEGLKIFRDNYKDFDLVITDQSMPGMTGIELGKEIISISPITPVLLLTSFNDFFTQDSLLGAGIKKFLVKPVSFNELSETIRILIQKAKEK